MKPTNLSHPFAISLYLLLTAVGWLFFWEGVPYTNFGSESGRCYSANGNFYIIRYLTPFRAKFGFAVDVIGTAKLFDMNGNLLFAGKTSFDPEAGPSWGTWQSSDGKLKHTVSFLGTRSPSWIYALPSSPGNTYQNDYCRREEKITRQMRP